MNFLSTDLPDYIQFPSRDGLPRKICSGKFRFSSEGDQALTTNSSEAGGIRMQTLLTITTGRTPARSRRDGPSRRGNMADYKSHGGRILMAKTMRQDSGAP
jgi:hypothetical protein